MPKKNIHPSVHEFKAFVKNHPKLVVDVRQGKAKWQDLYEEWYLLGENDPKWDDYKTEVTKKVQQTEEKNETNEMKVELFTQLLSYIKHLDMNQIQQYLGQLSDVIDSLQGFVSQMKQDGNNEGHRHNKHENQERRNPFLFRKD